jgi:hypothetical protein
MSNTFKGCTALLGIAALSGAAFADGLGSRVSIDLFPRNDAVPQVMTVDAADGLLCWNNGDADDITAHQSQETSLLGNFYTADDFFVKAGTYKYVDSITFCFLVSDTIDGNMFKPEVGLRILGDCNGRPDDTNVVCDLGPLTAIIDEEEGFLATNNGASATFPGFNEWEFCFDVDKFFAGYTRLWLVPYGVAPITGPGSGLYFWRSANMGQIQGVQGQIKNGAEPWQDVQECDCPGICTDFCFQINGHVCCLLADNSPFDSTGGDKSLQLFGAAIDTARAADSFQVPPHGSVDLCRLECWMATNCPLEKVFVEIYENNCNMPGAKIITIDLTDDLDGDGKADYPIATDTGADYLGCNIYHFVWPELVGYTLDPGRDYWISFVARGTGSILDKAYWMYRATSACHICITEGKVKNPFVEGLEDFTFVSEATSGAPRDFAFQVYTNEVVVKSGDNNEGGNETAPTGNSMTDGVVLAPNSINGKITRR